MMQQKLRKLKKNYQKKIETASTFKNVKTEKILGFFTKIAKDIKNEFENLEIEENRLAEENKKIR